MPTLQSAILAFPKLIVVFHQKKTVIVQKCLCLYCLLAHDDAIWSVAWGKNKKDGSETVISGSLDDLVKVWKW